MVKVTDSGKRSSSFCQCVSLGEEKGLIMLTQGPAAATEVVGLVAQEAAKSGQADQSGLEPF